MYSWEINEEIEKRSNAFDSFEEFEEIRKTSPQIKYTPLPNGTEHVLKLFAWTDDGFEWVLNIKRQLFF